MGLFEALGEAAGHLDTTRKFISGDISFQQAAKRSVAINAVTTGKLFSPCSAVATSLGTFNKAIDSKALELCQTITSLIKEVSGRGLDREDIHLAVAVLAAVQSRVPTPACIMNPYKAESSPSLANFRHYLKHATAVYGTRKLATFVDPGALCFNDGEEAWIRNRTGITGEPITWDYAGGKCPEYYLCVDHERQEVVLAVRGTMDLNAIVLDLDCQYYEPEDDVVYHRGIDNLARELLGRVKDRIGEMLRKNPGYRLTLTGHSLGGAVAAEVAISLSEKTTSGAFVTNDKTCQGREIHCYAIDPAATINPTASRRYEPLISSLVHDKDFVPTLSYGLLQDIAAYARYLRDNRECLVDASLALHSPEKCRGVLEVFERLSVHPRLVPPGRVYAIERVSGKLRYGEVQNVANYYPTLRICINMLCDHFPVNIEKNLSQLGRS